jgi:hypothetical protein
MSRKFDDVTVRQIDYMKHAIGYSLDKVKRKAYAAYRNYFTTSKSNEGWNELVELGLAGKRPFEHGIGEEPTLYYVTDLGLNFLSGLLGIKIIERD